MALRNNFDKQHTTGGFTLIEVLVTLGIVVLALGFTLNIGFDTYNRAGFSTERLSIVRLLQNARGKAIANIDGEQHGILIDVSEDEYVLFAGDTPSSDDNPMVIPFREGISVAADDGDDAMIIFRQNSGQSGGGEIVIDDGVRSGTIEINTEGGIVW